MKKSTFLLGVISSFLILLGVAFKIEHWPGAAIAVGTGVTLFALCYSTLLLMDKNALAQNDLQKFVNLMTMIGMIVIPITFFLKVQHLTGARIGMYASHIYLLVMIPVLFYFGSKETDPIKKLNIYNSVMFLIVATAISFIIWLRSGVPTLQ
jgi:hypothetical protein